MLTIISYQNNHYEIVADESVLDCLLRNDVEISYVCKAGVCHVCVMACPQGDIEKMATEGLSNQYIENGYFLACQCFPKKSLSVIEADDANLYNKARVIGKETLSANVCRIILKPEVPLYYGAGQFINIRMDNQQIRSYSLASIPAENNYLQLHIKRMRNGLLSNWLFDQVKTNDILDIQGPFGDCLYQPDCTDSDILMIATGTGLAPLYGILQDALEHQHRGSISLYHGESHQSDLYLTNELTALALKHSNLQYFPCVTSSADLADPAVTVGRASDLAFQQQQQLQNHLIYLCGSPEMVGSAKIKALSLNAKPERIYADPFVTKDLRLGQDRSTTINS